MGTNSSHELFESPKETESEGEKSIQVDGFWAISQPILNQPCEEPLSLP